MFKIIKSLPLFLLPWIFFSACQPSGRQIPAEFIDPPREFSLMPFWFWNDTLKNEELVRQIGEFEAKGIYGFVIHPRIGLPHDVKWLSDKMISAMHLVIREAAARNMYVILYDEGAYPSGSSAGQVVERNPEHAARGLAKIDLKPGEEPCFSGNMKLITITSRPDGSRVAIIEQPSGGVIRGLHYLNEGEQPLVEFLPPAGDILNPDAVTSFIELVYDRFAVEFSNYFGNTIMGIFTDEPEPLGRSPIKGMVPGNASLLLQIKDILGYDITPYLTDLWYEDHPDSKKHRVDYYRAVNICLEENYYKRLGNWCSNHNIALMGHPAKSMDIGTLRYFHVPGQDLVWRYVEPGPKALEGQHSTMAKCASSAMIHLGRRRNSNEIYGAYGHNLTYEEMVWLANWCFVRGHNLLFPHAFYYSVRGPRFDERPPDVGPNAVWWKDYKPYADACRRLSWINTDSWHVCNLTILCEATWLPDRSAKTCYQYQHDFNYLEIRHLLEDATVNENGVNIKDMNYGAVILDSLSYLPPEAISLLQILAKNKRLIINKESQFSEIFKDAILYTTDADLVNAINSVLTPDLVITPYSENIRFRHVVKANDHYYLLFNEENTEVNTTINIPLTGKRTWLDPYTAERKDGKADEIVSFRPYEMKVLWVRDRK